MLKLSAVEQVPENPRVGGNLDSQRFFDCPHRGQGVRVCSDSAGTLHEMMGIPGIPSLEDDLNAPEHLAGAPGIHHLAARHFNFDAKMSFNPGDRIYHDFCAHSFLSSRFGCC